MIIISIIIVMFMIMIIVIIMIIIIIIIIIIIVYAVVIILMYFVVVIIIISSSSSSIIMIMIIIILHYIWPWMYAHGAAPRLKHSIVPLCPPHRPTVSTPAALRFLLISLAHTFSCLSSVSLSSLSSPSLFLCIPLPLPLPLPLQARDVALHVRPASRPAGRPAVRLAGWPAVRLVLAGLSAGAPLPWLGCERFRFQRAMRTIEPYLSGYILQIYHTRTCCLCFCLHAHGLGPGRMASSYSGMVGYAYCSAMLSRFQDLFSGFAFARCHSCRVVVLYQESSKMGSQVARCAQEYHLVAFKSPHPGRRVVRQGGLTGEGHEGPWRFAKREARRARAAETARAGIGAVLRRFAWHDASLRDVLRVCKTGCAVKPRMELVPSLKRS